MAEEEEQKVDPNQLNLKVVAQSGEEVRHRASPRAPPGQRTCPCTDVPRPQIFFKVKQSTKFSKIMSSYCTPRVPFSRAARAARRTRWFPASTHNASMVRAGTRQNIQSDAVRFLFDGDRIRPEQTPQDLGMENDGVPHPPPRRARPAAASWLNPRVACADSIDVVVEQVGGGEA